VTNENHHDFSAFLAPNIAGAPPLTVEAKIEPLRKRLPVPNSAAHFSFAPSYHPKLP